MNAALTGRTALVTGGARGIGEAICRELASLGAHVLVVDINADGAGEVAKSLPSADSFAVDLADPQKIDELISEVKSATAQVDILVNNAGWDQIAQFHETEPPLWDRLLAINLRAPIQLTHAFLPAMREQRGGRLIFIASDAARVGSSGEAVYSACKAGLNGFAKTIARENARRQVTSNTVCPGPSNTPLTAAEAERNPKFIESLTRAIPIGRLAEPEDIAGVVGFLATDKAAYLTGQTYSVSGGLTMF